MSKWIQKLLDAVAKWLNGPKDKPVVKPPVTPPVAPPVVNAPATGALIDPPGFDKAYVAAHSGFEECGMDGATGVFRLRCTVIYPIAGGTCILSSPFLKHFRKGSDGSITYDQDFMYQDGVYHCRGFCANEPRSKDEPIAIPGNVWRTGMPTWPLWDVRKEK